MNGGQSHMKQWRIIIPAALAAALAFGAPPEPVKVKASKKTADSHRNTAAAGRRSVERSTKDIFYEFELSTMSPALPDDVTVKWAVVTLDMFGEPRLGTAGEKQITLPKNKATIVETDDFSLASKDVHTVRRRSSANTSAEEKILGYGVRIVDGAGSLLSETISPGNARKSIEDAFSGKLGGSEEDEGGRDRKRNKK